MFEFLKSFFVKPTLRHGDRVNLVRSGCIERADGLVLGEDGSAIVVEWPNFGITRESPYSLAVTG